MIRGLPVVAFLGYGRAGKDTAGEWLSRNSQLRYIGSSSNVVLPMIARDLNMSEEETWAKRHEMREYWKNWCNRYREKDQSALAKKMIEQCEIVVGLRDKPELEACRKDGIIDQYIWIHRDVPKDPTVTFTADDCDLVIYNTSSLTNFYSKLYSWLNLSNIPKSNFQIFNK